MYPRVWVIPLAVVVLAGVCSVWRNRRMPWASVAALLCDVYFFVLLATVTTRQSQLRRYDLAMSAAPAQSPKLFDALLRFVAGTASPDEALLERLYPPLRGLLIAAVALTAVVAVLECIRMFRPPRALRQ